MYPISGWHKTRHEGKTYVIRMVRSSSVMKFVASDLVNVWLTEIKDDAILKQFQKLNPLIECSDCSIIYKMIDSSLLEGHKQSSQSSLELVVLDDDLLELKFKSILGGLLMKLHINLQKESPQTFFNEVTLPILKITEELLARQNLLCDSLEKKDLEISQYKLEGAILTRKTVETQSFSKDEFLSKFHAQNTCTTSLEMDNVISFLNLLPNGNPPPPSETENHVEQPSCSKPKPLESQVTKTGGDSGIEVKSESNYNYSLADCTTSQINGSKLNTLKRKKPKLNL